MQQHIIINKENQDFLTSCFLYYQKNIYQDTNTNANTSTNSRLQPLSNSFKKIKTRPLVIIDYPNLIHILYETYLTQEEVAKHFYQYLLKNMQKKTIVILCKQVTINHESYNIDFLLNLGRSLSDNHFLSLSDLFIYQIDYETHISSSMDDLLGYFICFVCFVYYVKINSIHISEKREKKRIQKHIQYLTNDKQYFDKNLFGKTKEERKKNNHLLFEKLIQPHNQYILEKDTINQKLVLDFFKQYMVLKTEDTQNLECNMDYLTNLLLKSDFERKKQFTYQKLNGTQKIHKIHKIQKKGTLKKCNFLKIRKKMNILPSYYLYTMIKYTQNYLKDDYYGSFSKEEIIDIFTN